MWKSIIAHVAELFFILMFLTIYLFSGYIEWNEFICWSFSFYWWISCN